MYHSDTFQVGLLKHTGEFLFIISIHTKSSCEPNYTDFPFGIQLCKLKFGSWINEQYKVEYRVGGGDNETNVVLDDFSSPTGWKVKAAVARLESRQYPLFEEPTHTVVYEFAFSRNVYFDQVSGKLEKVK